MKNLLDGLQSLFLFGGCGLVAFGWFLQQELGRATGAWSWLWLAGAMLIYNLDRLHPDPADAVNTPLRRSWHRSRKVTIVLGVFLLVLVPVLQRDWLVLGIVLVAAIIAGGYSLRLPFLRRRVKDFPALKNLFPAAVITAALLFPAFYEKGGPHSAVALQTLAGWAFLALLINLLICDQRDVHGDLLAGVRTPANALSTAKYRLLLWFLFVALVSAALASPRPADCAGLTTYLALLIAVADENRPAWFYNWAVDGMLFVPALQVLATRWIASAGY